MDQAETRILSSVERVGMALAGVAILLSLLAGSIPLTLGVTVGSLVGLVNFRVIRFVVARGLRGRAAEQGAPRWAFLCLYFLKFGALIAIVYLLIRETEIDTIGLAIGLSTVFLATLVVTFRDVLKARE